MTLLDRLSLTLGQPMPRTMRWALGIVHLMLSAVLIIVGFAPDLLAPLSDYLPWLFKSPVMMDAALPAYLIGMSAFMLARSKLVRRRVRLVGGSHSTPAVDPSVFMGLMVVGSVLLASSIFIP